MISSRFDCSEHRVGVASYRFLAQFIFFFASATALGYSSSSRFFSFFFIAYIALHKSSSFPFAVHSVQFATTIAHCDFGVLSHEKDGHLNCEGVPVRSV